MATHLLHLIDLCHLDVDGTVIYRDGPTPNIFHRTGEQYILSVAFNLASGVSVPANYYLGLDNRLTLSDLDAMVNLSGEPSGFGYGRQPVSSLNGFSISLGTSGKYQATTNTVAFTASGGSWGPVRNLFLATSTNSGGFLISSVPLRSPRTVTDGQSVTMRLAVALGNC